MIKIDVKFGGGLETLFGGKKAIPIELEDASTVKLLLDHLSSTPGILTGKKDMFVDASGSLRPGILVLIDNVDWELSGEEAAVLENGNEVVFVSTLHGG